MDDELAELGDTFSIPESGPVALSLSQVKQFEALRLSKPMDQTYHWQTHRPLAELAANPCHGPSDPLLMLHYEDGRPVAGLEAVRDRVVLGRQTCEWMWTGNQNTLPDYRGRGLMTSLFTTVKTIADERGISIGGAGTTPAGRASYLRNGFKFWGPAPRRALVLRTNRLVGAYLAYKPLESVGSFFANALVDAHRMALQSSVAASTRAFEWTLADDVDCDVSSLFSNDPRYPRFTREREKLAWRWDRCKRRRESTSRDCRLGFLRTRSGGELAGYLMLRLAETSEPGGLPVKHLRLVTVLDWAVRYGDRAALRALVSHAVRAALEMNGEILEFSTTDRDMQAVLRHRGFLKLGGSRLFYYAAKGSPIADKEPDQLRDWWWNGCDSEDTFAW